MHARDVMANSFSWYDGITVGGIWCGGSEINNVLQRQK